MTQCIMPRPAIWQPGSTHKFQIAIPQTCAAESEKVQNLRRHIAELEAQMTEISRLESKLEFLSMAKMGATFVSETCAGFLDLAASILDAIPHMNKAALVAKGGVTSIRFTQDAMAYRSGQISGSQFTYRTVQHGLSTTDIALSGLQKDSMASKLVLKKTETVVGAVGIAMKEQTGGAYALDELRGNADLISSGLEKELGDKAKTVRVFKGLQALDGVIVAAKDYHDALDKMFTTRLEERTSAQQWAIRMRANTRQMIRTMQDQLNVAIDDLNQCVASDRRAPMSSAVF